MKQILICTACVVALSLVSAPARATTEKDAAARAAANPELIVQARQSASQPGAGRAAAGQQIKLFAPATLAPALPGAKGAVKDDAGFDQDPMQCTAGQDGTCAIALPREQFPVAATYEADAGMTGQASVNARPGSAASPVAGLFAFGFMPAMPLAYNGLMLNPAEKKLLNDGGKTTDGGTTVVTKSDGKIEAFPKGTSIEKGVDKFGRSQLIITLPDGTKIEIIFHPEGRIIIVDYSDGSGIRRYPDGSTSEQRPDGDNHLFSHLAEQSLLHLKG